MQGTVCKKVKNTIRVIPVDNQTSNENGTSVNLISDAKPEKQTAMWMAK